MNTQRMRSGCQATFQVAAQGTAWAVLLVAAVLLGTTLPAMARQSDATQPIDVQADRSEFDEKAGTQTLIGNVEIAQGSMRISADRITVTLENNALSRIDGEGSPIRFEQENEAGELVQGEAAKISYDAVAQSLILSGAATLKQPRQNLSSERIVFDSRSQKVSAEGGDKGRVQLRIEPPAADAKKP